ncbi:hypothetical protein HRbin01_01873 [archaeon HR01]|nr:hypothetical protein HRbin01_01873 [archaeon HR01]
MKKTYVLLILLVMACSTIPIGYGKPAAPQERLLQVLPNGLLKIVDTVQVDTPSEEIELGFTSDMRGKLVTSYVQGVDAQITISDIENNIFFIKARPPNTWSSGSVVIVSIWKDMLLKTGDNYELIMAINPLMREASGNISITLRVPEGGRINSLQPSILTIVNNTAASGSVNQPGGFRFTSLRAVLNLPSLTLISIVRAELNIEQLNPVAAKLMLRVRNEGDNPVNEISVKLSRQASITDVRSSFEKMKSFKDGDSIVVQLNNELGKGESIDITILYEDPSLVDMTPQTMVIHPPELQESVVGEYLVTVKTPPASDIRFDNLQPWQVLPVGASSTAVSYRFENFFPRAHFQISLNYTPSLYFNPLPPLLVILFISIGAAVVIPKVRVSRLGAALPTDVKEAVEKAVSQWFDIAVGISQYLNDLEPTQRSTAKPKQFEDLSRAVKRLRDQLSDIRRRHGDLPKNIFEMLEKGEKSISELSNSLTALARSAEDYATKKTTRRIYERIYREYRRLVEELAGEVNTLFDELRGLK